MMSEVYREADTSQMALEDPWKVLDVATIPPEEIVDLRRRFRVVKAARYWAESSDNESSAIFAPSADSMDWDIFRPSENDERLKIKRRTKLVLPIMKTVIPLTACKSSKHLMESISHAMIGWFNMFSRGKLHGDINPGTIFALDEDEEEPESTLSKNRYEFLALEDTLTYMSRNPPKGESTEKCQDVAVGALDLIKNLEDLLVPHDLQQATNAPHEDEEEAEDSSEFSEDEEDASGDSPERNLLFAPETWEAIDKLEDFLEAFDLRQRAMRNKQT